MAWDNSNTHEDDEIEEVLRGAAGRLVPLYLPTYSPWLNPIEMLRRHFRREVTHCEHFPSIEALIARRPTVSSSAVTENLLRSPRSSVPTPQKLRECT